MTYTKSEVDYSKGTSEKHCGICVHYDDHKCEIVTGPVDPAFWCEKFKKSLRTTIQDAIKGEY